MSGRFKVACIQINAGPEIAPNVAWASAQARKARDAGADLICMPENVSLMEFGRERTWPKVAEESAHPALAAFRDLARETGAWLAIGSLAVKVGPSMLANRSFLIAPDGAIKARYDKIHMFDVDLDGGESYRESALYQPGRQAVVADTPWARLGLSICYDVRFPYLYRSLSKAGATVILVPAAFTRQTGRAHWHILLRARAIENLCYVVAAAQCGDHVLGRQTYGHSLVVAPWGEVLADGGEEPGLVMAEIDQGRVADARRKVPSLGHDRAYDVVSPDRAVGGA
ncbi:MAG: carbon-nitrogen hydrolase family protein [Alphaproteobacteria bacterium]